MPTLTSDKAKKLRRFLEDECHAQGFELVGFTKPDAVNEAGKHFLAALESGYLGAMDWMEETAKRRMSPLNLWPDVRSIIMLAMNYGPEEDPRLGLNKPDSGVISVYARHRDYHELIKGRLKHIASRFAARAGEDVKVFVDTAPVLEKPLAGAAGLGWQGKHTNLVNRDFGSWLFLGAIFTSAEITPDTPETDHCGSCRACLDACPTNAFPAPYQLDARRCISYLTIELKKQIPLEFRKSIGNRIYGCDDCLAACPWNKFAKKTHEMKLQARHDLTAPPLAELLTLDDAAFRTFFSGSPIKRIGRNRFIRNCLLAAGNSNDPKLIAFIKPHLTAEDSQVRAMAVWALSQLLSVEEFQIMRQNFYTQENDKEVRAEWET